MILDISRRSIGDSGLINWSDVMGFSIVIPTQNLERQRDLGEHNVEALFKGDLT